MKALCIQSIVGYNLDKDPNEEITLFKEGNTYKVWEGFYEKEPVLFAEDEIGEITVVADTPDLEKGKFFQEYFEITSYVD